MFLEAFSPLLDLNLTMEYVIYSYDEFEIYLLMQK
jgi:hypothetical protein